GARWKSSIQRQQTSVAGVAAAFAVMIDCKPSGSAAMANSSLGAKRSQTGQTIAPVSLGCKFSSVVSATFCIQSSNSLSLWEMVGVRAYGTTRKKGLFVVGLFSS